MVEHLTENQGVASSILALGISRGLVQLARTLALGARGPRFESAVPDQSKHLGLNTEGSLLK